MSKITKDEVTKIAKLARIELTDKEKEKFSGQLSEILNYVEQLNQTDTSKVSETSQVTGLTNVYREDVASELTQVDKDKNKNREKLLNNAPDQQNDYIKVKAVLE